MTDNVLDAETVRALFSLIDGYSQRAHRAITENNIMQMVQEHDIFLREAFRIQHVYGQAKNEEMLRELGRTRDDGERT